MKRARTWTGYDIELSISLVIPRRIHHLANCVGSQGKASLVSGAVSFSAAVDIDLSKHGPSSHADDKNTIHQNSPFTHNQGLRCGYWVWRASFGVEIAFSVTRVPGSFQVWRSELSASARMINEKGIRSKHGRPLDDAESQLVTE